MNPVPEWKMTPQEKLLRDLIQVRAALAEWIEEELEAEAEERMTPEEREQDRLYRESLAEEFVDPFAEIERRSEALSAWERNR